MDKTPFSIYDFFGYLASGFIMLVAVDFSFRGGQALKGTVTPPLAIFWIIVAYIAGQIIANLAGYFLEAKLARKVLRAPEELLFEECAVKVRGRLFPGYYSSLPLETRTRVMAKAQNKTGAMISGRALFLHCHPIVKRDQVTLGRLNTFLNIYGFCRNVSMASLLSMLILLTGSLTDWWLGRPFQAAKLWWAGAALISAVGMFYRYLKFFRHYTVEVFLTYAEVD